MYRCEQSLCKLKKKPKECTVLKDCVDKGKSTFDLILLTQSRAGLCKSNKPCSCLKPYCSQTSKWGFGKGTNCRNDQVLYYCILL